MIRGNEDTQLHLRGLEEGRQGSLFQIFVDASVIPWKGKSWLLEAAMDELKGIRQLGIYKDLYMLPVGQLPGQRPMVKSPTSITRESVTPWIRALPPAEPVDEFKPTVTNKAVPVGPTTAVFDAEESNEQS